YDGLCRRIKGAALEKHIRFLGFRSDARQILRHTGVYVVSSIMESFGLTVVEAAAAGKPVVATRCGGPEEIIQHGETGLLEPVNDPDRMADAIVSLINDQELRRTMGLRAKKRYAALFRADLYARQFEALYTDLSQSGKTALDRQAQMVLETLLA